MLRAKKDEVFDLTDGHCYYCGEELDRENFHVDHFIPQNYGGKNKDNLVPACPDCNIMKSDYNIEEFRMRILYKNVEFIEEQLNKKTHGRVFLKFYQLADDLPEFYFEKKDISRRV